EATGADVPRGQYSFAELGLGVVASVHRRIPRGQFAHAVGDDGVRRENHVGEAQPVIYAASRRNQIGAAKWICTRGDCPNARWELPYFEREMPGTYAARCIVARSKSGVGNRSCSTGVTCLACPLRRQDVPH